MFAEMGGCCPFCSPKPNRLLLFEGSLLHGVIPVRAVTFGLAWAMSRVVFRITSSSTRHMPD